MGAVWDITVLHYCCIGSDINLKKGNLMVQCPILDH